ncbi:MAG: FHA domain-containing protein [Planctomycetes bacterium]|nr:FHA domain-containing protein [Planctomycetota bacterium]
MSQYCALTVVRDGEPRWRLRLNAQVTLVGRDAKLPGCLNDPKVSRRHAVFVLAPGGGLIVHDLGSRNGLYLNGARIPSGGQVRVANGDRILAGNTELRVEAAGAPGSASAPPPTDAPPQELCLDDVLTAPAPPRPTKRRRGSLRWRRSRRP